MVAVLRFRAPPTTPRPVDVDFPPTVFAGEPTIQELRPTSDLQAVEEWLAGNHSPRYIAMQHDAAQQREQRDRAERMRGKTPPPPTPKRRKGNGRGWLLALLYGLVLVAIILGTHFGAAFWWVR